MIEREHIKNLWEATEDSFIKTRSITYDNNQKANELKDSTDV